MAVTEGRFNNLEKRVNEFADRVGKLEGHSAGRPQRSSDALVITLISIVGVAIVGYLGWIGAEVVDHGKKLAAIEVLLAPEQIKQAATDARDLKVIRQTTSILTNLQHRKQKIDPRIISDSGQSFLDVSQDVPQAWSAVIAFLNYRSFLNVTSAPSTQDFISAPTQWTFEPGLQFPVGVPVHTQLKVGTHVPADKAAVAETLGSNLNPGRAVGYAFLLVDGATVKLDDHRLRNVIFANCSVIYDGGPIQVENVYFVNCSFEVSRKPAGEDFAKAVLTAPAISLTKA